MKGSKKAAAWLLILVMALGLLPGCQSGSANGQAEQDAPAPDRLINGARVVVDGIVHTADIYVRSGKWLLPAEDAEAVLGSPSEDEYVDLDGYARSQDISCEFDEALNAVYLSTWSSYGEESGSADFDRAFQLGLVPEEWRDRAKKKIKSRDFRAILASMVERLAPDQMAAFDENVTDYNTSMTRGMGFIMVYYASKCLGADTFNNDFDSRRVDGDELWNAGPEQFLKLFPHCGEGPETCGGMEWADPMTAAYLYSFWHSSPVSGSLIFDFEEETGKMRQGDPLTVQEAVSAATRLYDSVPQYVSLDDPRAAEPDEAFLTAEHMKAAGQRGEVTSEDHPVWTGFIFGSEYSHVLDVSPDQLKQNANFGFNSARIKLDYESLFNEDVTQVNLAGLQALDSLVATAIAYNLHLNICFTTLPGRTASNYLDYTSQGEFDLFLNPEKQEQADRLWALIAERYRDVPSAVLSFSPFWEALNKDLSTGLPFEDYGPEDVGRYLARVLRVIREADPDRLVIYEPTPLNRLDDIMQDDRAALAAAGDLENTIISYNFCEQPYVYASMTVTQGENVDNNNHSMFPPEYPTYIYSVGSNISAGSPVTIDGLLPEGTRLDLYLRAAWGGVLTIAADGEVLYQETVERADYECEEMVSGFFPYAVSEKKISVTLPADTEELVLTCSGDGPYGNGVHFSGMDLYLPEAYARERWYYGTSYDVFSGAEAQAGMRKEKTSRVMICPNTFSTNGTHITVQYDLTYTTESIMEEASADTIRAWGDRIETFDGNCVVRYECALFGGTIWSSMEAYYRDTLSMFVEHGFSWWSNDWYVLVTDTSNELAGEPLTFYGGCSTFNLELLKLLQQYQCSDR